jgi:TolA-binding protein/TM2 domain-containing membrane protein YozV
MFVSTEKILLIVIVLGGTILADCADAKNTADRQFEFATALMKQERYKTSITEFQRFLFLFPNDKRVLDAHYQMGLAYQKQKQYVFAMDHYHKIIQVSPVKKIAIQAAYALSDCYQEKGNFLMAENVLESMLQRIEDEKILDEIHYRLGWIHIRNNQLDNAMIHLNAIKNGSAYPLNTIKHAILSKKLPGKRPYLAGMLSVVPGLGQVYCGRYRDATLSLIVNGIIGWAAWESFDHDRPALGTLISFFGLGFYSGNIYGAINSAHKHNRRAEKQWYYKLKRDADSTNIFFGEN